MEQASYLHIIYSEGFYGWGMLFSPAGFFLRAIPPRQISDFLLANPSSIILDPCNKENLTAPHLLPAARRFEEYFSQLFTSKSLMADSSDFFEQQIVQLVSEENCVRLILDLGAGSSNYLASLPAKIIRLDLYGVTSDNGNQLAVVADGHDLPFKDGLFDAVIANFVFEHMINPLKCLKECSRVLEDGGKLIITVPSLSFRDSIKGLLNSEIITLPIHHFHFFSLLPVKLGISFRDTIKSAKEYGLLLQHVFPTGQGAFPSLLTRYFPAFGPWRFFGEQTTLIFKKLVFE